MPATIYLPNGLCLLVEELPHTHSVSLGCFVGVGARYEPAPISGMAHLIEHMCFKGTHALPTARIISQTIDGVGGVLEAATSYETTVYWAKVADIYFDRALHVISELVRRPLFDPHELEKERRVIIEELRGLQDSPGDWVDTLIQESLWNGQPLGRDIAGSLETVGAIRHQELHDFWAQHYIPTRMVVSVAGNVATDAIVQAVTAAFGTEPGPELGSPALPLPTDPAVPGPRLHLTARDIEQSNFCIGLPALSYNDPDRRTLDVLDMVLGGSMSSRLLQELREERGLAYSIGSYASKYADAGIWVVYGSVDPETLTETVGAALEIMHQIATDGISEEELQQVKEQVKGGILLSFEDTWAVASRNGSLQLRYGKVIPLEQVVAEIEAVTCADARRVARRVLQRAGLHLAVIGPHRDPAPLQALIEQWNP